MTHIYRSISAIRRAVADARNDGHTIAFVPTMGALHAGHVSLIGAARDDEESDSPPFIVVSIFVNPTQFGPSEDYSRYPRDENGDLAQCREAGAHAVFTPPVEVMYPPGAVTKVSVAKLTDTLCGPFRPGHFDGVATIVTKLFNIVQPDVAYFGQKDAQQLAVIRRMTADLDLPVRIVGCPTVREPDGLALSSRNRYLSASDRVQALSLYAALTLAREMISGGERNVAQIERRMHEIVKAAGPSIIDYISVVDPQTLAPVSTVTQPVLVALAVRIGGTRLIDNMTLSP